MAVEVTDWYSASLGEIEAFLDRFQNQDRQVVRVDSDLVAALVAVMNAAAIQAAVTHHLANAGQAASQLS